MLKESGFYRGVNLGGWMSQCDYSPQRLDGFITEPDFAQIAAWGFDHVRIPIDYNVVQNPDGSIIQDGLERIDRALQLCEKYGLNTVLDLHKTQGYSFDAGEKEAGFFDSEDCQELFYRVWEAFAQRYGQRHGHVMFELLNEVTEPVFLEPWKRISRECIRRIRRYAPVTKILVGSYHYNSVRTVKDLDPPCDENVLYNFHCYEPHFFTHQGAYWGAVEDKNARYTYEQSGVSAGFFRDAFASAVEKAMAEGTELYCGEYGVIDVVPPEEALKWFRDIHSVFEQFGIARCVWSYKQMDFGIADSRMDPVRDELLRYL